MTKEACGDTMRIRALARAEIMIRVDGDVSWLPIALKVERARVKDRITCDRMIVALDHQAVAIPDDIRLHRAMIRPCIATIARHITIAFLVDTIES